MVCLEANSTTSSAGGHDCSGGDGLLGRRDNLGGLLCLGRIGDLVDFTLNRGFGGGRLGSGLLNGRRLHGSGLDRGRLGRGRLGRSRLGRSRFSRSRLDRGRLGRSRLLSRGLLSRSALNRLLFLGAIKEARDIHGEALLNLEDFVQLFYTIH
jgi:hypothetical protein